MNMSLNPKGFQIWLYTIASTSKLKLLLINGLNLFKIKTLFCSLTLIFDLINKWQTTVSHKNTEIIFKIILANIKSLKIISLSKCEPKWKSNQLSGFVLKYNEIKMRKTCL